MPKRPESAGARGWPRDPELQARADAAMARVARAGAKTYDRDRDLPGLIRLDPGARGQEAMLDLEAIVARLERALRAERNRARSGHWTYDLNRHIALRQAHLAESARLAAGAKAKSR